MFTQLRTMWIFPCNFEMILNLFDLAYHSGFTVLKVLRYFKSELEGRFKFCQQAEQNPWIQTARDYEDLHLNFIVFSHF